MSSVYPKTQAEYEQIKATEQGARAQRINQWPEFSEYTSRYLMHMKTESRLSRFVSAKYFAIVLAHFADNSDGRKVTVVAIKYDYLYLQL